MDANDEKDDASPEAQYPDEAFMKVLNELLDNQKKEFGALKDAVMSSRTDMDLFQSCLEKELELSRAAHEKKIAEMINADGTTTRHIIQEEVSKILKAIQSSKPVEASSSVDESFKADILKELKKVREDIDIVITNQRSLYTYQRETKDDTELIVDRLASTDEKLDIYGALLLDDANKGEGSRGRRGGRGGRRGGSIRGAYQRAALPSTSSVRLQDISDRYVLTPEGTIVEHVPYPGFGSFRSENLDPALNKLSAVEKIKLIMDENKRLKAEAEEKKKREEVDRLTNAASNRLKGVSRDGDYTNDQMVRYIIELCNQVGLSLADGRRPDECVTWWLGRILDGDNLFEAFQNYIRGDLTDKSKHLMNDNFQRVREDVNTLLRVARERARKRREEEINQQRTQGD